MAEIFIRKPGAVQRLMKARSLNLEVGEAARNFCLNVRIWRYEKLVDCGRPSTPKSAFTLAVGGVVAIASLSVLRLRLSKIAIFRFLARAHAVSV